MELLARNPARILRLEGGTLTPGSAADLTILAPDAATEVAASRFRSKGRNTPFDGWRLRGSVAATLIGGRPVYVNGAVAGAEVLGAAPAQ